MRSALSNTAVTVAVLIVYLMSHAPAERAFGQSAATLPMYRPVAVLIDHTPP